MWQYNSGLRTLDNKNGNWKYLHVHWTLPLKDDNEKMLIETINGEVLGINDKKEIVLQNETYSLGELLSIKINKDQHIIFVHFFRFITIMEIRRRQKIDKQSKHLVFK